MFGHVDEGLIHIFFGKMGSGKTTNAMREALRFHAQGRPVWLNFPLSQNFVPRSQAPIFFEDDPVGILSMRDGLFVLDEAYLTINSREWAKLPKAVFTAFTHVRKLHMTVIVIAQSWMRIDKSIREVSSRARQFHGSGLFGHWYDFTEYEIDEMGEIIKHDPVEYQTARHGFAWVPRSTYGAFETDHLFSEPPPREWPSAIGHVVQKTNIEAQN